MNYQEYHWKRFLERRDVKVKNISLAEPAEYAERGRLYPMSEDLPEVMTETVSVITEIHENTNIYN
ncbi:MAG: hypothetical protein NT010_04300 [Proteobacteria bacterium]|nr:hypothetical protein [Pseudomonadota bacterium]